MAQNPGDSAENIALRDTILLRVGGMSCAGCVSRVERALSDVPGVEAATVNFAGGTVAVTGSAVQPDLVLAVEGAGYTAEPLENESIEAQETRASVDLKQALAKSALALLGGGLLMADM